jgi:hypothetical protein
LYILGDECTSDFSKNSWQSGRLIMRSCRANPSHLYVPSLMMIACLSLASLLGGCSDDDRPVRINGGNNDADVGVDDVGDVDSPDAGDDVGEEDPTTGEEAGVRLTAFQPRYIYNPESRHLLKVPLKLENISSPDPISPGWNHFRIVTEGLITVNADPSSETLVDSVCRTNVELEQGGSLQCEVIFELGSGDVPNFLRYVGLGDEVVEVELLTAFDDSVSNVDAESFYLNGSRMNTLRYSFLCECAYPSLGYGSQSACENELVVSPEKAQERASCGQDLADQKGPAPYNAAERVACLSEEREALGDCYIEKDLQCDEQSIDDFNDCIDAFNDRIGQCPDFTSEAAQWAQELDEEYDNICH